jgi:fatty-acyl-CoA synthase
VIGVPNRKFGDEVMAYVKRREGSALTEEELREFCRGKIAHSKVPRYVAFIEDFPATVTGKVQKYLLREMAVESLGLQAEETATA